MANVISGLRGPSNSPEVTPKAGEAVRTPIQEAGAVLGQLPTEEQKSAGVVQVSSDGAILAKAVSTLQGATPVRAEVVTQFKSAIATGNYKPDLTAVADAIAKALGR
jgi:flagellar biosynthesis anti-sigma factor FlgM